MFSSWGGDADCSDGVISSGLSATCQATFVQCSVTLLPTQAVGGSIGGSGLLSISTGPSCEWSASSSAPWLRVIGTPSGSGSGSVPYVFDPRGSFSQPRTGVITVSGQTFTLTQNGIAPTFSVTPTLVIASPGAGPVAIQVSADTPDATWTASTATPWLSVPASGGVGPVALTLTRNVSTEPRSGNLTIAGITVPITQRGNGMPGEPVELAAAVVNGQARFAWLPPPADGDATSYRLEAGLTPGAATFAFDTPDANPGFDVSGVPPGRFYLRVRGRNEFGTGPASEEYQLDVTPQGLNRPGRPRNIAAAMTLDRLVLTWDPPYPLGALDGYVLEAGTGSGTSDIATIPLGLTTTFAYDGVPPGYYFLRLRAVNAAGASAASQETLLVVGGVFAPPGAPSLQPAVVAGSTVNLSWLGSSSGGPAARYRLEVGSRVGSSDLAIFDTQVPTTALGFTGVPRGRYYVRVRGVNSLGAGPISNEIRIDVP